MSNTSIKHADLPATPTQPVTLFEREDGRRSVAIGDRGDESVVPNDPPVIAGERLTNHAAETIPVPTHEGLTNDVLGERWPDELPDRLVDFLLRRDSE